MYNEHKENTVDSQGTQAPSEPHTIRTREHHTDPTLKGRTFRNSEEAESQFLGSCVSEQNVFVIYGSSFFYFETDNIIYWQY